MPARPKPPKDVRRHAAYTLPICKRRCRRPRSSTRAGAWRHVRARTRRHHARRYHEVEDIWWLDSFHRSGHCVGNGSGRRDVECRGQGVRRYLCASSADDRASGRGPDGRAGAQPDPAPLPASKIRVTGRAMAEALALARAAGARGEVPVGAVVVCDGAIVGRGATPGRRQRPDGARRDRGVARGARALGNYRLPDCELYVTLEPCAMCAGAIMHARSRGWCSARAIPKTGACGTVVDLFGERRLNHHARVHRWRRAGECGALLPAFFAARREGRTWHERGYGIGIYAPAGFATDPRTIDRAVDHALKRRTPRRRRPHVRYAVAAILGARRGASRGGDAHGAGPRVEVAIAVRGGYGCSRLLDRLDFAASQARQALARLQRLHRVPARGTCHGEHDHLRRADGGYDFGARDTVGFHARSLLRCCSTPRMRGRMRARRRPRRCARAAVGRQPRAGRAPGGHAVLPDVDGGILFVEDIGEQPYRVERMLYSCTTPAFSRATRAAARRLHGFERRERQRLRSRGGDRARARRVRDSRVHRVCRSATCPTS